jgi:restriction system protein
MAHGYQQIREELASELLRRVKEASPAFFERLVIELLVAMGYGGSLEEAGSVIGKSGDGGIDGIIKEDKLGLDTIYVQAKRWANVVGRPEIQKFAGALQGQRARKGIFITTSSFTKEAEDFASSIETRIVLIDGDDLSDYMIDHGVGVTSIQTYTVKRLDSDFFVEE